MYDAKISFKEENDKLKKETLEGMKKLDEIFEKKFFKYDDEVCLEEMKRLIPNLTSVFRKDFSKKDSDIFSYPSYIQKINEGWVINLNHMEKLIVDENYNPLENQISILSNYIQKIGEKAANSPSYFISDCVRYRINCLVLENSYWEVISDIKNSFFDINSIKEGETKIIFVRNQYQGYYFDDVELTREEKNVWKIFHTKTSHFYIDSSFNILSRSELNVENNKS